MTERTSAVVFFCLFRVLLPAVLLAAVVFRYNGLSLFYLVILLVVPLLEKPSSNSINGSTGRFLKVLTALSTLPVVAHATFHIVLVALATDTHPYGSMLSNCSTNEKVARQIGFQRLDGVPYLHAIRLVLPDVGVWLTSILILVTSRVFLKQSSGDQINLPVVIKPSLINAQMMVSLMDYVGEFFIGLFLAAASIMVPSVLSSVYFLVFLVMSILWASYKSLGTRFARFRVLLMIYTAAHILVLHLYQFQFFQEVLNEKKLIPRILGLTGVVYTDCSKVYSIEFYKGVKWWHFVNPGALLLLYWVLAYETRNWLKPEELSNQDGARASMSGRRRHKKGLKKRSRNTERQVPQDTDVDEQNPALKARHHLLPSNHYLPRVSSQFEKKWRGSTTGSLMFSGSTYGEDEDDEPGRQKQSQSRLKLSGYENPQYRLVEESSDNINYNALDQQPKEGEGGASAASPINFEDSPDAIKTSSRQPKISGGETKRTPLVSILVFVMQQSYVLMLISMMAWSIMYVSWATFALLLAACLLWMLPNSRRACLVASPLLVLYVLALTTAQYIFNMDMKNELPITAGSISISQIGLKRFNTPPKDLAFHIFFTMFFLMTLRQFVRERRESSQKQQSGLALATRPSLSQRGLATLMSIGWQDSVDGYDSTTIRVIGHFVMEVMSKYFIFICSGMLLLMAVQEVVIYRVIYMILFLLFIICFQISYTLWRTLMFMFWWTVIIYSMAVLIIIYTYQFEQFPDYWRNTTGFSDVVLADIGLKTFSGTELFIKLLTPTSFLIVIILQVHYYHKPFLRLSALDRYRNDNSPENPDRLGQWIDFTNITSDTDTETEEDLLSSKPSLHKRFLGFLRRKRVLSLMQSYWQTLTTFLWRWAEIHAFKVVILVVMYVVLQQEKVSALTAVYIILVAVLLPFMLYNAHLLLSHLIVIWTCIIILAKMLYQLKQVPVWEDHQCNRTALDGKNRTFPDKSLLTVVWFGLEKLDVVNSEIDSYIQYYILILVVVIFETIVRYHQAQIYNAPDMTKPKKGILFNDITRDDADKGLLCCIKFFANYAFYKFGLEICYVVAAVTVCVRMDVFGVLYTILLATVMLMSRPVLSRIWWIYLAVLAILLPIQFLVILGFPPLSVFCFYYPWENYQHFSKLLERWLYLPDLIIAPPSNVLMVDVLQLVVVAFQWRVFRNEASIAENGGGSNDNILVDVETCREIPVKDFTVKITCYLDVCKQAVFEYMFWVTLAVAFIAGASRINIFGLGYVIAVFWFMWYGKEFLLKPLRRLLHTWNMLIAYVVFVLFAKACLQLVGCVYINDLMSHNFCWVVQLFGINCLLERSKDLIQTAATNQCIIVEDNTGMSWEVVCFAFLLLQRRIYSSHYFRHVVDLLGAENILCSRGAQLINRILVRQVEKQNEQEKQILINIKKKMKILKKRQASLRKDFQEPTEHFQAIRAGDYYLFEDTEEEMHEGLGMDLLDKTNEPIPDSLNFGRAQETEEDRRLNPLQVITTAMDRGAEVAIERVKQQDSPDMPSGLSVVDEVDASYGTPVEKDKEKVEKIDVVDKAKTWGQFFAALMVSLADWLIALCNRISRNYRIVAQKMEEDLRLEKEKIKSRYLPCPRAPIEMVALDLSHPRDNSSTNPTFSHEGEAQLHMDQFRRVQQARDSGSTFAESTYSNSHEIDHIADDDEYEFDKQQPRAYRLLVAVGYMLISRSELLCYFLMVLDQIIYASLLSMPLPFMVFLWGMLSVPRPSKTFWITVITYTEAVIVAKYLFQFGFFPWNNDVVQDSPFFPPRILGIEQKPRYADVDIALLLALFIHRSILKKYGLWKDSKDISQDMEQAGETERQEYMAIMQAKYDEDNWSEEILEPSEQPVKDTKIKRACKNALAPFVHFFKKMTENTYNATVDVYAPMFCCDFINFFIVVFGYQEFGPQQTTDGNLTSYISENKVPIPFLIMLITQFLLIVVDRALFLRKNVMGKFIFQTLLVILIHVWMFFALPYTTHRMFYVNKAAQLWYFVKCVYFALSAYQIRCGYPTRILGNFLTKQYGYLNLFLFKGFLSVPFLLELRSLMDWIWTDSTLALGSWLQMEDIYANIFVLKCWREAEINYPTPRAQKKTPAIKYGVGGLLLFLIILIIWFPLVLFAIFSVVFTSNPPIEITVQLQVGAFQPLFKTTVQQNIRSISESEHSSIVSHFERERASMAFLNDYKMEDITVVEFDGASTSIWGISKPALLEMIKSLHKQMNATEKKPKLEVTFSALRQADSKASETLTQTFSVELSVQHLNNLSLVINGSTDIPVLVEKVFPRFLILSNKGIKPANAIVSINPQPNFAAFQYDDIQMNLYGEKGFDSLDKYWGMKQRIYGNSHFDLDEDHAATYSETFKLITFNERRAPDQLTFISGYGIIGLYVSFILLIGRFLRMSTTGQYLTIIFRELPDVDNILQLCLDIYLVREMKDFMLEEDLYAKLVFLYRSPETMIKASRLKVKVD